MTDTVVTDAPEAREPSHTPRTQRVALAVVLAVIVLGVAGIAAISRAGSSRLPLLPVGASGAAAQRDSAATAMMMPARPVDYRLSPSVNAPADRARAYEFAPADPTAVENLRDALGLKGSVKSEAGAWMVADGNRVLRVQNDPAMSWFFSEEMTRCGPDTPVSSDGAIPPDYARCASTGVIHPEGSVSSGSGSSASPPSEPSAEPCPMPPCPEGRACIQACPKSHDGTRPPRPSDLPSQAEAQRIARAFFDRAGVGEATLEVHDGYTAWSVVARPTFQGLTTIGYESSAQIGPRGEILSAQGMLGRPAALGEYPLVDLTEAVERLKTGFVGHGRPMPMGAADSGMTDPGTDMTLIAPVPPDGIQPPHGDPPPDMTPVVVTITSVRLALEFVPSYNPSAPSAHLIPAFVFGTDEGGTVNVLAVEDEYLDTAGRAPYPGGIEPDRPSGRPGQVEPQPAPAPSREPADPSDRGQESHQ